MWQHIGRRFFLFQGNVDEYFEVFQNSMRNRIIIRGK